MRPLKTRTQIKALEAQILKRITSGRLALRISRLGNQRPAGSGKHGLGGLLPADTMHRTRTKALEARFLHRIISGRLALKISRKTTSGQLDLANPVWAVCCQQIPGIESVNQRPATRQSASSQTRTEQLDNSQLAKTDDLAPVNQLPAGTQILRQSTSGQLELANPAWAVCCQQIPGTESVNQRLAGTARQPAAIILQQPTSGQPEPEVIV